VRSAKSIGLPERKKVKPATVKKFETLIKKRAKRQFSPDKDEETARLLKLVKKKQASKSNVVEVKDAEPEEGKVIDLVQVLKRSLSGTGR
jgi:non-homologous end joining protein Ku